MKLNSSMKTALMASICLAATLGAAAQEKTASKTLSLNDAIQLSLQHNKQLKMDQARVDAALARVQQAEEKRQPELSASASYLLLNQPGVDLKMGSGSGQGSGATSASLKLNQALIGQVSASVPIYAGGQIRYGIQSARYLAEASRLDAEVDKQAVIQNTIAAYTNLYKAGQTVKVIEQNLQESHQRVVDFTNLEKNGLLARNDLMKAALRESNIELALLEAKNNQKDASVNMSLMLGLPEQTMVLTSDAVFDQVQPAGTLLAWEDSAFANRKEFASNARHQDALTANLNAVKGSMMPSVAATGGYFSAYLQNIVSITNAVNVGVGVKYNISSLWKTKSKVNELQASQRELVAAREQTEDRVRLQVNKSYEAYLLSQKKNEVYDKAIEQATENYRITNNKYQNGLATLTEVLDADLGKLQAQINKANAKADASLAYASLLQAAGTLNESFGK